MSEALALPSALTQYLGVTIPDDRAAALLDHAADTIRGMARQRFDAVTDDVVRLDPHDDVVLLPELPVNEVTALQVPDPDGDDPFGAPAWITFPDKWVWSATGVIRVQRSRCWPYWARSVQVTYSHGFDADDVPSDLASACVELAADMFANPMHISSQTTGGISMRFDRTGAVPPSVAAVIDRYTMLEVS